ncbi:hypothetical protein KR018_004127 [Drosophila ironensis]|nr:hypothetical protein KR018_004127 [Drosophila ironensis]
MFNSNIPAASLLSIEGNGLGLGGHTPKTPEILNSLIAMTNPLDNFSFGTAAISATSSASCSAASTPVVTVRQFNGHPNGQLHSQDSSHSSCSGSPLDSPAGTVTTPSVQQTCSRLIKEGLKLSIQSKRKLSTCDSSSGSEQPHSKCSRRSSSNHNGSSSNNHNLGGNNYSGNMSNNNDDDCEDSSDEDSETKSQPKGLTPEDEDRRRRRRERNKIAATKCRMKKRERTQNLIKESEVLDIQNVELKNQARLLETERRKLMEMLQSHGCQRAGGCTLPAHLLQSPAQKYLPDLELEVNGDQVMSPNQQQQQQQQQQTQRVQSIPSMATFKFGSKTAAAMAQQLPNGYCKASPNAQEFEHAGYQTYQQQQHQQSSSNSATSNSSNTSNTSNSTSSSHSLVDHQQHSNPSPGLISDYVPNCDGITPNNSHNPGSNLSTASSNNTSLSANSNTSQANQQQQQNSNTTSASSAIEFVKNELVDSESPYTTALSAERFLFEPSEGFPDIKHAVSVLPSPCGIHGLNMASVVHGGSNVSNGHNNNNNNHLMDFHQGLHQGNIGVGVGVGVMTPCYDDEQLLLMKNGCYANDLLSQLVDDGGEYVDLDTATAFITNGDCMA